jgi:branched-chain amino acid transport system ATP-binding protein
MTSDKLLWTEDLAVGYKGVPVLEKLNLSVGHGEIVALLGRNGVGKTTILHTLAGLVPLISGTVHFDGLNGTEPTHVRVKKGLALITEERAIVRRLTVGENLRLGTGSSEAAFDIFPELQPLRNRKAGLLSGGEQQMLAVGRSLAARPRVLLVDEMSFGLAPMVVRRLSEALKEATAEGIGVLMVEQHPQLAFAIADRGYVFSGGKVVFAGESAALAGRLAEIEESYLSSSSILEQEEVE